MIKSGLLEIGYGIDNVSYRADDGCYKPLAASEFGRGEGDFQV
jgi:hypothetical protein